MQEPREVFGPLKKQKPGFSLARAILHRIFSVGVLLESEDLLQNEAKTLCFTVFFDHQGAEN